MSRDGAETESTRRVYRVRGECGGECGGDAEAMRSMMRCMMRDRAHKVAQSIYPDLSHHALAACVPPNAKAATPKKDANPLGDGTPTSEAEAVTGPEDCSNPLAMTAASPMASTSK